jgi:hypothetical protein
VPARVDVLIAAGNLTEAERPHCMFWPNSDLDHWDGTPEHDARGRPGPVGPMDAMPAHRKSEKAGSL